MKKLYLLGLLTILGAGCVHGEIIYRPAHITDLTALLDLDYRICFEYFKPLFITACKDMPHGKDPDRYLGLDMRNDAATFPDCIQACGNDRLHVAYDATRYRIAGFVVFHKESEGYLEIDLMQLDKEYRGLGVGKELFKQAVQTFANVHTVGLYVFPGNVGAENFWQKLGFIKRGRGPADKQHLYGLSYADLFEYYTLNI